MTTTLKMLDITVTLSGLHCIQCTATYNVGMAVVRKNANRETSTGKFLNNYCCNTYVYVDYVGGNIAAFNNLVNANIFQCEMLDSIIMLFILFFTSCDR